MNYFAKAAAKLILAASLANSFCMAGIVDGVAAIVDSEPITLLEVYQTSQNLGVSKQEAINILVLEKIEEIEIKKHGLGVDELEISQEIDKIAKNNNLTAQQFRELLEKKGVVWDDYKNEVRRKILKERLYNKIAAKKLVMPEEEEIRRYYDEHKSEFIVPKTIDLVKYTSASRQKLSQLIANPLISKEGVAVSEESVETSTLNPRFAYLLMQTPENNFTPILTVGSDFVVFYVKKKSDGTPMEYDQVKNAIISKIMEAERERVIKDYLEKKRATVSIKALRIPD